MKPCPLTGGCYTFEQEKEIDVAAVQREIDQLEKDLAEVRKEMVANLKELGLTP